VLKFINFLLTSFDSEKLLISGLSAGIFALFYYIAIIISSGIINLKLRTKIISTLVAVVITITGVTAISLVDRNNAKVYVCGSETASITVVSNQNENVLIISDVSNVFSLGNLRRLNYKSGINNIDTVIFGGGYDYDMPACITRLRQVFNLNKVYYYGKQNKELEIVMANSFPNIKVKAFTENKDFSLVTIKGCYNKGGLSVDILAKGKRIVAFSTLENNERYDFVDGDIDLLIAGSNVSQLNYWLKPKEIVSYRAIDGFNDGESNGNFAYSFK
jgi:hypothetical protein